MGTQSEKNGEGSYAFEVKEEPDLKDESLENIRCVTIGTTSTAPVAARGRPRVSVIALAVAHGRPRASLTSPTTSTDRRKILWTLEEERRLIDAWFRNSPDPIRGAVRKAEQYWGAVYNEFHANDPEPGEGPHRSKKQMKDHWQKCSQVVIRFNKIYMGCVQNRSSGQSDEQVIEVAERMYHQEHHAHFNKKHWWRLVKDEQKWIDWTDLIQHNQESQSQGSHNKRTRLDEIGSFTSSDALDGSDAPTMAIPSSPTRMSPPPLSFVPSNGCLDDSSSPPRMSPSPLSFVPFNGCLDDNNNGQGGTSNERALTARALIEVEIERMKLECSKVRARETYFKRLEELEEKDTSNMTPAQLERHNKKIQILWDLFESGNT